MSKNKKVTKNQKNEKFELQVVNTVATLENEKIENEKVENEMTLEYYEFLKGLFEKQLIQNIEKIDNTFEVRGLRKTIFVKIDELENHARVFTILNKLEMQQSNARNILHLKSLKALKSYTTAQSR